MLIIDFGYYFMGLLFFLYWYCLLYFMYVIDMFLYCIICLVIRFSFWLYLYRDMDVNSIVFFVNGLKVRYYNRVEFFDIKFVEMIENILNDNIIKMFVFILCN